MAAPLEPAHILIVDDHPLFAEAIAEYLSSLGQLFRVSTAPSMVQALAIAKSADDLRLALLDLHMPDMDGLTGLRHLRETWRDLKVAIMSGETSAEAAREAMSAGADGFIPKTMSGAAILHAVQLIVAGERFFPADLARLDQRADSVTLTLHERAVLEELSASKSNKEIALALKVAVSTVTFHLTHLYRKLAVTGRMQAVRRAFELGLLDERRR